MVCEPLDVDAGNNLGPLKKLYVLNHWAISPTAIFYTIN